MNARIEGTNADPRKNRNPATMMMGPTMLYESIQGVLGGMLINGAENLRKNQKGSLSHPKLL